MAYIANPNNYDTDDDAVFSALLSQGLVWIEDDDEYQTADSVVEEAWEFINEQGEEWVNFSRLSLHLYETFGKLDLKQLGQPNKNYKNLVKLFADYPNDFELKLDQQKNGLYWIKAKQIS
jgi:hypothetical protein